MPFLGSKDAPDTASAHAGADLGKTTLGHRIFTIQELTKYILGAIPEHKLGAILIRAIAPKPVETSALKIHKFCFVLLGYWLDLAWL